MAASVTLKVMIARVVGLVFVLTGGVALTMGYLGWQEGSPAPVATTQPVGRSVASPRIVIRRTTATPKRISARARSHPSNAMAARPSSAHPAAAHPTPPSQTFWRRATLWSLCALALGMALVGYSLHERPKIVRSGADEMLNEPTPF